MWKVINTVPQSTFLISRTVYLDIYVDLFLGSVIHSCTSKRLVSRKEMCVLLAALWRQKADLMSWTSTLYAV